VARAKEKLGALEAAVLDFMQSDPYRIDLVPATDGPPEAVSAVSRVLKEPIAD
jgi:hypothetical protein